jgi:hypothetical protein
MKIERVGIIMYGAMTKLRGRPALARRRPVLPAVAIGDIGSTRED